MKRYVAGLAVAVALAYGIRADDVTLKSVPPVVAKTIPQAGADDVDPKLTEIKVTFSKDAVKPGEELEIQLDQLPPVWSGEVMVNAVRRFPISSKKFKLAAVASNGFRDSGQTDIYILLLDANGRQVSLPNNGFFHVAVAK